MTRGLCPDCSHPVEDHLAVRTEARCMAESFCGCRRVFSISRRVVAVEEAAYRLEGSDQFIVNVHDPERCAGNPCPIHNRTRHHMRRFPQHFRGDRGFMERTCPHGVGHPDPDDPFADPVHGCDGCCVPGSCRRCPNGVPGRAQPCACPWPLRAWDWLRARRYL